MNLVVIINQEIVTGVGSTNLDYENKLFAYLVQLGLVMGVFKNMIDS